MPRIEPVFALYVKMVLAMGLVFQMPAVVYTLARIGLVTARFLIKSFKYAVLDHLHRGGRHHAERRRGDADAVRRADDRPLPDQHRDRLDLRQEAHARAPRSERVVIKRSSAREVSALLQDLETGPATARDAAVARLAVIGTRAVEGLLALVRQGGTPASRAARWPRSRPSRDPRCGRRGARRARRCGRQRPGGRVGAVPPAARHGSRRGGPRPPHRRCRRCRPRRPSAPRRARRAAPRVRPGARPALGAASGRSERGRSRLRARRRRARGAAAARGAGTRGRRRACPTIPDTLRQWLAAAGAQAPLPTLHRIVQLIHERERATADPGAARRVDDGAGRSPTRCWRTAAAPWRSTICARRSRPANRRRSRCWRRCRSSAIARASNRSRRPTPV